MRVYQPSLLRCFPAERDERNLLFPDLDVTFVQSTSQLLFNRELERCVCLCVGLSNNAARHLSFKVCPLLTE